jgi:hypothetical protein
MQIQDHHQISKLLHRGTASCPKQHARYFALALARGSPRTRANQKKWGIFKCPFRGILLRYRQRTVDFEYFQDWLVERMGYGDGSKGGRPPFDPVAMFKILVVQAQHNLSDARMEYMIRNPLS